MPGEAAYRVVLINPPVPDQKVWVREGRCQQWDIWGAPFPPFSLAMISTQLKAAGIETRIIDSGPQKKNLHKVLKECREFQPAAAILSSTTPTLETDLEWFASRLKAVLPSLKIAALGIHVTALPKKVLARYPSVDCVIVGEPEITARELAEHLRGKKSLDEVRGLGFRDPLRKIILTPPREFAADIDSLGFPDWGKINFKHYRLPIRRKPFSLISFSRGCPFTCQFCAAQAYNGKVLRKRTIQSLIEEIRYNLSFGVRDFLFWTEQMTLDHAYLNSFLDRLCEEGLDKKIRWVCNSRVDSMTSDLAGRMRKAGCWQIAFGFEFGSDALLQAAQKGGRASLEQGRLAAEAAHRAGIAVDGHFLMGYPGETKETLQATIDFAASLPLTFAHFYSAVPFPGSPLFEEAIRQGWLEADRWELLTQDRASLKIPSLSREVVDEYIRKAYQRFYFRPQTIFRILSLAKNPREYFEIFRIAIRFYGARD